MANSYSIEIGGRFNAAQLQQALDAAAKGRLTVNITTNAQQVQQAVKGVETAMNGVVAATKMGKLQYTEYLDKTGEVHRTVLKTREAIGQTVEVTSRLNAKTKELEVTGEKVVQNYEEVFRQQQKIAQQTQRDIDRRIAKEQRENEILQRRLGLLQQGVNLKGASRSDILSSMGFSADATITPSGAFTPVAGQGTWQRYIVSVQEGARAFHNYAVNVNEATGAARKLDMGITETNKALAAQGETWDRLIVKVAKWALLTSAIYAPIRAFKEALSTMKEVDSELVTIQKVTDLTAKQIDSLTASVYGMASAYGRTADELLSATSTFARAGFRDNLEEMTELSALLQNVGDLSADDASKFLLAANAAWRLEGNYNSLMQIIDGMNEVTNKSANDMQALTDAITVAGSVFANAGESAQTYTAMVGTVVASTQRSGSEVGRGLRTIAMNIRQIKGELEDGEIIDEKSISDAAAALHSVGVSVSENGELRKVSDVLTDLAKRWNDLTTAEQSYVSSTLAGKRQANVLIALMQNFDEYEKELQNYASGTGSALKENEIYLDSWEAKTKILSATWTEFVSNLVETKAIKGGLNILIAAVETLNSALGRTAVIAASVVAAIGGLGKRLGLQGLGQAGTLIGSGMAVGETGSGILAAMQTTVLPLAIGAAALAGFVKIYDDLTISLDEHKEILEDLNTEYDKMFGAGSEYDTLIQKAGELNDAEATRLSFLEAQRAVMQKQIEDETAEYNRRRMQMQHKSYTQYSADENGIGLVAGNTYSSISAFQIEHIHGLVNEAGRNLTQTGDVSAYKSELAGILTIYEDTYNLLKDSPDLLDDTDRALLALLDTLIDANSTLNTTKQEVEEVAEKFGYDVAEHLAALEAEITLVTDAINENNTKQKVSQDTMDALLERYPDLITKIKRTEDGYTLEDGALEGLIADREKEVKQVDYYAKNAAINYINALDDEAKANHRLGLEINATTNEIIRQLLVAQAIAAAELNTHVAADAQANWGGELARNLQKDNEYAASKAKLSNINTMLSNVQRAAKYEGIDFSAGSSNNRTGGGGGSGSSRKDTTDPILEAIKAKKAEFDYNIWLSEQQQGLLEKDTDAYKAKTKEQADYYVAMQKWAHEEADRLRGIDAEKYKDNINELSKYWWSAQNWLKKNAEDTLKDMQNDVKTALKQLKANLEDQTDDLDAQIARIKALIDLEEQFNAIQKSIRDEQADISEQLRIAKESYQYLDEETRKLLFNESDYKTLSKELRDIQRETTSLYEEYQKKISNLNKSNIYEAEILTSQYEQQLAAKQKEYEIAKANLALAKAQTQLNNVQNNRNTLMLINGQFQWVADPKAVKSALEELADAESDAAEARRAQTEQDSINAKKATQTALEEQKERLEAEYKAISKAWEKLSDSMATPVKDIQKTLTELAQTAAPEFKAQIEALSAMIAGTVEAEKANQYEGMSYIEKLDAMTAAHGISKVKNAPVDENEVIRIANEHGVDLGVATSMAAANRSAGKKLYDRGGVARGAGIMLKAVGSAEGVLSPSVMTHILNPEKNKMFEQFVGSLTALFGGGVNGMQFRNVGSASSLIDNSITVNGMEVVGRKGENLADAARAILPIYTGGRV